MDPLLDGLDAAEELQGERAGAQLLSDERRAEERLALEG